MSLHLPTNGYLEVEGPIPIRQVQWVQIATLRVRGGLAGRPLGFIDIAEQILTSVTLLDCSWELRDESWSVEGIFENEPVRVLHLPNPFRQDLEK
jgi:hypothetical protein